MSKIFMHSRLWQLILLFTLFLSCKKEINSDTGAPPDEVLDLSTKVPSSVSGFVTDQANAAVAGASVKIGTAIVLTNRFGYFSITGVQVVKQAATVTVTFPGYFRSIKTYKATEGKAAYFRIKLLPKTISGTVDAATDGIVSITGGTSITIPANGVKTGSGNLYSGQVSVAAQYLDPASPDISRIMPGDLRGVNKQDRIRLLTTYGMVAVELSGAGGELLQIADGKKAQISMPIPSAYSASAPMSIPLWYFNEDTGLWVEDGSAQKVGNQFVGEVSHFSYWNCDVPNSYVNFDCVIVTDRTSSRTPVASARVRLTEVGNPANTRTALTDQTGYVGGPIPNNTSLLMEVFIDGMPCGIPVYSQTIVVVNSDISLGDVVVATGIGDFSSISGTVKDCQGNPISNGHIMVQGAGDNYAVLINNAGNYQIDVIYCNTSVTNITLTAFDLAAGVAGQDTSLVLPVNTSVTAELSACGAGALILQPTNNPLEWEFFGSATLNSSSHTPQIDAIAWTTGGSPVFTRGAVHFDLSGIPAGATITDARLSLFSTPNPLLANFTNANFGNNNAFNIKRISSAWTAIGSTWANQPATTDVGQVTIPHTNLSSLDLIDVDVTGLVSAMQAGPNYGFMLQLQTEDYYNCRQFCSSIHADASKHPRLIVRYQ